MENNLNNRDKSDFENAKDTKITKWTGIDIKERVEIKDAEILIAEKEIILMFDKEEADLIKLFNIIKKIEEIKDKTSNFIIFIGKNLLIQKKKIKKEYLLTFSFEEFIRIIECLDEEVYYSNKHEIKKVLGLEWRFEQEIGSSNSIIRKLLK